MTARQFLLKHGDEALTVSFTEGMTGQQVRGALMLLLDLFAEDQVPQATLGYDYQDGAEITLQQI